MLSSVTSWLRDMAGTAVPVLALVAIAGGTDALIMLHSKDLLAVYMTGNSTKLGQSLMAGAWSKALPLVSVIACFFMTSTLAAWLASCLPGWRAPVCLSTTALLLACAVPLAGTAYPVAATCLIAAGIGAINQTRADEPGISFITGNFIRVARHLGEGKFSAAAAGLMRWIAFVAGAALSTLLDFFYGTGALAILAATVFAAACVALLARNAPQAHAE